MLVDHILRSNSLLNDDGLLVTASEYKGRPFTIGSKGVPGPPMPLTEAEAHMLIAFALRYLRSGNHAGRTVLHEAAARGRLECVQYILDLNARTRGEGDAEGVARADIVPLEMLDNEGNTALHLAVQHMHQPVVVALLEV